MKMSVQQKKIMFFYTVPLEIDRYVNKQTPIWVVKVSWITDETPWHLQVVID